MLSRFARACARLNDHWIGDLVGALSLFALGYVLLFLAAALEPGEGTRPVSPNQMETRP